MFERLSKINNFGFTLLELLMVIAIIGILIAISFSFLGRSKDKGGEAGIQSNLVNARSQAEVFFTNNNGVYEGVCSTSGTETIGKHVRAAARSYGKDPEASYADGTASAWNMEACHDSDEAYAVWVPLKASTSASPLGLCIDSANTTREITTVLGAGEFVCPSS